MEGESKGHTESPGPAGDGGGPAGRRVSDDGTRAVSGAVGTNDPREAVQKASEKGMLDAAQAKALMGLVSRLSIMGFESRRIISVMVNNIASERSGEKRRELALHLKEYLEGDGLAKDLVPPLSESFSLM